MDNKCPVALVLLATHLVYFVCVSCNDHHIIGLVDLNMWYYCLFVEIELTEDCETERLMAGKSTEASGDLSTSPNPPTGKTVAEALAEATGTRSSSRSPTSPSKRSRKAKKHSGGKDEENQSLKEVFNIKELLLLSGL